MPPGGGHVPRTGGVGCRVAIADLTVQQQKRRVLPAARTHRANSSDFSPNLLVRACVTYTEEHWFGWCVARCATTDGWTTVDLGGPPPSRQAHTRPAKTATTT